MGGHAVYYVVMTSRLQSVRVKVSEEMLDWLKREAETSERSVSATIRLAISEYRQKKEKRR